MRIRRICATLSGSTSASTSPAPRRSSRFESWRASARPELARDRPREHAEVGRLGPQLERAGLELGEVEQVGGELLQPLDLVAQLGEERVARLGVEVLVLEQLEEAAEREDRRAQLVRGGRDEALARACRAGASWRCMSSSATASWPSSSSRVDEEARRSGRRAATRRAVRSSALDAPGEARRRAARPAASASSSAIAPATRIRSRTSVDVRLDVARAARSRR